MPQTEIDYIFELTKATLILIKHNPQIPWVQWYVWEGKVCKDRIFCYYILNIYTLDLGCTSEFVWKRAENSRLHLVSYPC